METFIATSCPNNELGKTNRAIVNPADQFAKFEHIAVRYPNKNEAFVFTVLADSSVQKGQIAFNLSGRKWASLMTGKQIQAAPYKFEPRSQCLNSITFYVNFLNKAKADINAEYNTEDMAKQFSAQFVNQAFTVGQLFGFSYRQGNIPVVFELKVKEMESVLLGESPNEIGTLNVEIGLTTPNTVTLFEPDEGSEVHLVGNLAASSTAPKLFCQDWDLEAMGIGGLSEQFSRIFRRAFASRLLPPQLAQEIGIKHVRGMLLHGPPGTGKTLIARQIGKMLFAREPKIVNGPEILSKFVGESEANIRKLFKEAEEEQAKAGINSGLHMIIFDEIDSICKARGNSASNAGVSDNVVNQLLSKIDGVNSLHNVLLVGMTNRKDLIDEALLRPGRLELEIEIGLPNEKGRLEIFKIHAKKMMDKGVLDPSVSLEELAAVTRNYTGAEIEGLINAAQSLAVNRVVEPDSKAVLGPDTIEKIRVTREDFKFAMEHDVKPRLGANEDQLKKLAKPIFPWDPVVESIQEELNLIIQQIPELVQANPYFVLLVGDPGAGLTTTAANMAKATGFPFIKINQPKDHARLSESAKVQYIEKMFQDAARSEQSCLVIDKLETIVDYNRIGPRFSVYLTNALTALTDEILPEGHRMLVICTCNNEQCLTDLSLFNMFKDVIRVPSLTRPEQVLRYLSETGDTTFTTEQQEELISSLGSIPFKMGIKILESLLTSASRGEPSSRVRKFLEGMHVLKLIIRPSRLDEPFL